jgi:nicotinamidase-related amidase
MGLTTLDPRCALLLIDLQKGIVSLPRAHPVPAVLQRAAELAHAFRRHGLPVVLVRVTGAAPGRAEQSRSLAGLPPEWAELVPELAQQATDHVVTKRSWGAFTGTGLEPWLRARSVTQVVLAGIATSIGVESTARQAHELGLHVTLAVDAMTDGSAEAHEHSVARIFPRLGETGRTQDIVGLLERTRA